MVINCPHCQARLNLPDDAQGEDFRCAGCRRTFRLGRGAPRGSFQAASPEAASVAPGRRQQSGRRHEVEDGHHGNSYGGSLPPDTQELLKNAKSLAGPAGYAMLAAFFLTAATVIVGTAINIATQAQVLDGEWLPVFFWTLACSLLLFYLPMLTFMGIGARSLFTLGSRSLIVTAIVMNFIMFLLFCCGVAVNIVFGTLAPENFALGAALAMGGVNSVANLVAAAMATRVLSFREVADAYAARAEDQRRRR